MPREISAQGLVPSARSLHMSNVNSSPKHHVDFIAFSVEKVWFAFLGLTSVFLWYIIVMIFSNTLNGYRKMSSAR